MFKVVTYNKINAYNPRASRICRLYPANSRDMEKVFSRGRGGKTLMVWII